nr:complement C1q-like protein 4 [Crassostrea gigas]
MLVCFTNESVNADCNKHTTSRLLKNQISLLEKSVTMVVDSGCDSDNLPTAFHAEMSSTKIHPKDAIFVYDRVVTNEGSAYNQQTGKFTTPATGLYLFAWSALSDPGKTSDVALFVNGKRTGRIAQNNIGGGGKYITASSTVILTLKNGDIVHLADSGNTPAYLRGEYSTFSGVRLG